MHKSVAYTIAVIRLFNSIPVLAPASFSDAWKDTNHRLLLHHDTFFLSLGIVLTEEAIQINELVSDSDVSLLSLMDKFDYNLRELICGDESEITYLRRIYNYISSQIGNGAVRRADLIENPVVYIPAKELNLPEKSKPVHVVVIPPITDEEIRERVERMLMSGESLSDETMNNLVVIIKQLHMNVDKLCNEKMLSLLYPPPEKIPVDAEDFLRYLVLKTAGIPYLIRNDETIMKIKKGMEDYDVDKAFHSYVENHPEDGIRELAKVFLRHKNRVLFLAFKEASPYVAHVLNRVRKIADKIKETAQRGWLDRVTTDDIIRLEDLCRELSEATIYRKVIAANSLLLRRMNPEAAIYYIRNGRAFSAMRKTALPFTEAKEAYLNLIIDSIIEDVRPAVEGKKIFIPDNVEYAMPTGKKRFVGEIPFQSAVHLGKDVVFGIQWSDPLKKYSNKIYLNYEEAPMFGYQSTDYYRLWRRQRIQRWRHNLYHEKGRIVDSQDKEADVFFVDKKIKNNFDLVSIEYYDWKFDSDKIEIPFAFFIGNGNWRQLSEDLRKGSKEYLFRCPPLLTNIPNKLAGSYKPLGFLESNKKGNKTFWFSGSRIGDCMDGRWGGMYLQAIPAIRAVFNSCLKLKDILQQAGAIFEKKEDEEWDVDLSLEKMKKETILSLISNKKSEKIS